MLSSSIRKLLTSNNTSVSPLLTDDESFKDENSVRKIGLQTQKCFKALDGNTEFSSILNRSKKTFENSKIPNIRKVDSSSNHPKDNKIDNHIQNDNSKIEHDTNTFFERTFERNHFQNISYNPHDLNIQENFDCEEDATLLEDVNDSHDTEECSENSQTSAYVPSHQDIHFSIFRDTDSVGIFDSANENRNFSIDAGFGGSNYSSGHFQYEVQDISSKIESKIEQIATSTTSKTNILEHDKEQTPQKTFIHEVEVKIVNGISTGQNNILISLTPPSLGLINVEIIRTKRGKISEIKFVSSIHQTSDLLEENKHHLIRSLKDIVGYDDISFQFEDFPGLSGNMSYISNYSKDE